MRKTVVTGANGFVGQHLCSHLAQCGWDVHAAVRYGSAQRELQRHAKVHLMPDVPSGEQWDDLLSGTEAVIHLAARVHVMHDTAASSLEEYRLVNTANTVSLARRAAQRGVERFVFLSTIKVNGEATLSRPFTENDAPVPSDPYSLSKREAEEQLVDIAASTGMNVTTLRPPLIYGPGVKGNFLRLMKLVSYRVPLPLAVTDNKRSFLYVENLVSAVEKLLSAVSLGTQTFVISDDQDISTTQLLKTLAEAMNVEARLFRCPMPLLVSLAKIAGKGDEMKRMVESLAIDCSRIKRALQWTPPYALEHGIRDTAHWFRNMQIRA